MQMSFESFAFFSMWLWICKDVHFEEAAYHLCFSELISVEQMYHILIFFLLLFQRAQQLLCDDSQTVLTMCFCCAHMPFKICPISGFCIAPQAPIWASLYNCRTL